MSDVGCFRSFPKNASDARIRILQIRRGIALQREHLGPTENVIALAVRQQVGVFHRAEADDAGDFAALCFRQIRTFFGNNFERALLRLVQQIGKLHRLSAACFERLAVLAQNRAEPDVGQFNCRLPIADCRLPFAKRGKKLLEMQLLAAVGDVNDFIRLPGFHPVSQRRQIGCRIIKAAVAFTNQRRVLLQLRIVVEENSGCAFAFARDTGGEKFVHEWLEAVVVETFAE